MCAAKIYGSPRRISNKSLKRIRLFGYHKLTGDPRAVSIPSYHTFRKYLSQVITLNVRVKRCFI